MKRFYAVFFIITAIVVGALVIQWLRTYELQPKPFCANLPNGTSRCYPFAADMFYDVSGGQIKIVPRDLPEVEARQTYDVAVRTLNAHLLPPITPISAGQPIPPFLVTPTVTPTPQ